MNKKKSNGSFIIGILITVLLVISLIAAVVFISPNPTYLNFEGSNSQDISSYKLYYEKVPNPVTYDSKSYNLGLINGINLSGKLPVGNYNIGIVTVDKSGNESNMEILTIDIL